MSLLARLPLFAGLSEEQTSLLEQHALLRSFPKNSIIVTEGDHSDSLYIIASGSVRVYCSDEEGREITLNDLSDGDYFGEVALFDDQQRSASVITTSACRMLILDRKSMLNVFRDNPDLALQLITDLIHRVRALTGNVKNLALMDVYGRVANTLLELSEVSGDKRVTRIALTQQDIANRVGASREMVSRILKDLTTGGYICVEKKKIIINENLPANY